MKGQVSEVWSRVATLLPDFLMEGEAEDQRKVFDLELQADRILAVAHWLGREPGMRGLRLGYFGAGSGAAAVLKASARRPEAVKAVVCRGGWIDLARIDLPGITAPTLLIVGGLDVDLLEMNRQALDLLYRVVAANRYRILGKAVAAGECEGGTCTLHFRKQKAQSERPA